LIKVRPISESSDKVSALEINSQKNFHSSSNFSPSSTSHLLKLLLPSNLKAMAEVPPEQLDAQFHTPPHAFNQIPPKPVKDSQDGDSKVPLPKGVVLDKDGKP
jgi:hypothetical protein